MQKLYNIWISCLFTAFTLLSQSLCHSVSLGFEKGFDSFVNFHEILLEFRNEQIKLAHIDSCAFSDDCHEDVLTNGHFFDEVLVVHHCNLEVLARSQFVKLLLEVIVKNIDTSSESS